MDQCSFAFRVTDQSWDDSRTKRTITGVDLDRGDVSIVNYGASPTTSVDARALGRRARKSNLSLYQARARTRQLSIMNGAGRR
jgi:phage head maturation protease